MDREQSMPLGIYRTLPRCQKNRSDYRMVLATAATEISPESFLDKRNEEKEGQKQEKLLTFLSP